MKHSILPTILEEGKLTSLFFESLKDDYFDRIYTRNFFAKTFCSVENRTSNEINFRYPKMVSYIILTVKKS